MSSETLEYTDEVVARETAADAYPAAGPPFSPYIPDEAMMAEFSPRALALGLLLGAVFGASSLYLVLKVGLTVSSSIPLSIISISIFRLLSRLGIRDATILENNIVQTAGSVSESMAFGVGVAMPAVMILGFELDAAQTLLAALLGGVLGVLLVVPLRRAMIVEKHGELKYPEGAACAEILELGASQESRRESRGAGGGWISAKPLFVGFGVSFVYTAVMLVLNAWKQVPTKTFGEPFRGASLSLENSPALAGVGYIIGPRVAALMAAGGVFSYLVLIPMIIYVGSSATAIIPPGVRLIRDMSPDQVHNGYVLYIGAGAVIAGSIVSLFRVLPLLWHTSKKVFRIVLQRGPGEGEARGRLNRDIGPRYVTAGIAAALAGAVLAPWLSIPAWVAPLLLVLAATFVGVSAWLTGRIGSSSTPVSGITVATLLMTCAILYAVGATGPASFMTAVSVGALICVAVATGSTAAQNLKTGYFVGATPRSQQAAMLAGALVTSAVLAPLLLKMNEMGTVYVPLIAFEPAAESTPLPTLTTLGLPPYTGQSEPPSAGRFRVLDNSLGGKADGLLAGRYLVDEATAKVAYKFKDDPPVNTHVGPVVDISPGRREQVRGSQSVQDANTYSVWLNQDSEKGRVGKYLVDDRGVPQYYVDPGINGSFSERPDGSSVDKFFAPKATLIAYIIKGVLGWELPWGLVLLGVMLALVLELGGVPSLPFAAGLYLPLSSSTPILAGGMVRWAVDRARTRRAGRELPPDDEEARGPGVLMSSGYIAGGALAGIIFAFTLGLLPETPTRLANWMADNNPLYSGEYSDLLSTLLFVAVCALLYYAARGGADLADDARPARPNDSLRR